MVRGKVRKSLEVGQLEVLEKALSGELLAFQG